MAVRSEREKSKMQERYQMTLSQMLKEEDNKYCVDCDTKSPRWASWNIGVFICIRCAGFHRNLGVHISKVKSVNLDSWTGEQIASIQAMGNSRARAVYEANLPDGFRRPQSDSTIETFIRAKYEQRKWIAKEWIPPEMTVPIDLIESESNQERVETTPKSVKIEKSVPKMKPFTVPTITNNPVRQTVQPSPVITPTIEQITQNLLNLDEPVSTLKNNSNCSTNVPSSSNILDPLNELFTTTTTTPNKTEGYSEVLSIDSDLQSAFSFSTESSTNNSGVMSNEKIMALFNTPQTTAVGMNMQTTANQSSNLSSSAFAYPPPQHSHQKSLSFGSNLYQQAINQQHSTSSFHPMINHSNSIGMNLSTLQNSTNQSNTQFIPFTNPATSVFKSNIPMHSITELMPASSDTLWQ